MRNVGVIGLGDMGLGMAACLVKAGFNVTGFDRNAPKRQALVDRGGKAVLTAREVGEASHAVFVMVTTGAQCEDIILNHLAGAMGQGGVIIVAATIDPREIRHINGQLADTGLELVDCPVSGGRPGAVAGTLTLMAAGRPEILNKVNPLFEAVGKTIVHVGGTPGDGQTMKACLQIIVASSCTATAEAAALAARAGLDGEAFYEVVSTSAAGSFIANATLENINKRRFENTGSGIRTTGKDIAISVDLANQLGVPVKTAAAAGELLRQGWEKYPGCDNWVIIRLLEDETGTNPPK